MTQSDRAETPTASARRLTARGLLLGDRIVAAGLERADMTSANLLAFNAGANLECISRFMKKIRLSMQG